MVVQAVNVEEAVAAIKERGFYVAKNILEPELCDALVADIHRLEAANVPLKLRNSFHGLKTSRFYDLLNYGEAWQRLPAHPNILRVIRGVLGEDCLLSTYGTSVIGPGESQQAIHTDDGPHTGASQGLRERKRDPVTGLRESIVCVAFPALSDFTEENGATRLVPYSHKMDYPRPEDSEKWLKESVPAVMPKGSVVFWDGQTFHGGGPNLTDERRYGVLVDFCAGYLRSMENFLLSVGEEKAGSFEKDLQWLIGLRISKGGLGHVYTDDPQGMQKKVKARDAKNLYDKFDDGPLYGKLEGKPQLEKQSTNAVSRL